MFLLCLLLIPWENLTQLIDKLSQLTPGLCCCRLLLLPLYQMLYKLQCISGLAGCDVCCWSWGNCWRGWLDGWLCRLYCGCNCCRLVCRCVWPYWNAGWCVGARLQIYRWCDLIIKRNRLLMIYYSSVWSMHHFTTIRPFAVIAKSHFRFK